VFLDCCKKIRYNKCEHFEQFKPVEDWELSEPENSEEAKDDDEYSTLATTSEGEED
jgi:hypothetical protein